MNDTVLHGVYSGLLGGTAVMMDQYVQLRNGVPVAIVRVIDSGERFGADGEQGPAGDRSRPPGQTPVDRCRQGRRASDDDVLNYDGRSGMAGMHPQLGHHLFAQGDRFVHVVRTCRRPLRARLQFDVPSAGRTGAARPCNSLAGAGCGRPPPTLRYHRPRTASPGSGTSAARPFQVHADILLHARLVALAEALEVGQVDVFRHAPKVPRSTDARYLGAATGTHGQEDLHRGRRRDARDHARRSPAQRLPA